MCEPPPSPTFPGYELVVSSLVEAILVLSRDGRVMLVNPAAEAMLGCSRRDLLGRHHDELFADSPWILDLLGRIAGAQELSLRAEGKLSIQRPDVVAVVSVLRDRKEQATGTILVLDDVGQRHRLQEQATDRTRLDELSRLVASIAHEINNPLSGVRGAAQILGSKLAGSPQLAKYSAMIVRQADRVAELVAGLMRLEVAAPLRNGLNIHRVLREVMLLEQSIADQRGARIVSEFDPSLPEVLGDAGQLEQLFLNLLKNAIAACPQKGGVVKVTTRMDNDFHVATRSGRLRYIVVEVADNGPGLDAEVKQRMFTPFFTRQAGGHGLGLTIAHNIVTSHEGRINADSPPDGGALFRVSLPVAEAGSGQ